MYKPSVLGLALLLAIVTSSAEAQVTRVITGRVTAAADQRPIADALVSVAGAASTANSGATRTNERGDYRITVPSGPTTLIVRSVGFKRLVLPVPAGQEKADFTMEKDVLLLDQVVVTGQATTTEKRNATTAVSTVTAAEIVRAPASSLESALQGKVVGANINMNSGSPGGGGQIQIRGMSSILGSGDPLFVVDGVIFSNASNSDGQNAVTRAAGGFASNQDNIVNRLADINPNEIESIEVLKSAAATAAFGSRASNGVVVIKTKRGTAGKTRYTFSQRLGSQTPLKLLGSRQYNSLEKALSSVNTRADSTTVQGLFANGVPKYQDFQKQFFDNTAPSYETSFGASGGSENTLFRLSLTQKMETGLAPGTGARLQSGRLNLDQTIGSRLSAAVGMNFTRNLLQRGISNNDNAGVSPEYIFGYTPSIVDLSTKKADGSFTPNPFNGGGSLSSNPFQTFALLKADEDVNRQFGSGNLTYQAIQSDRHNLSIGLLGGIDRFQQEGLIYAPGTLQFEPNDGLLATVVQSNVTVRNTNGQLNANYTLTPKSGAFGLTMSGGTTYEEQAQNVYRIRGRGGLPGIPRADLGTVDQTQGYQLFRDESVFLNGQVSLFSERLNVAGGVRGDRSSANGDVKKFYVFPRASASYRTEIPFIPKLDDAKFRLSYGQTGNRPRYGDRDLLFITGGQIDGRPSLTLPGAVGNAAIRPETHNELEMGVDGSFFGQRLAFEITRYNRVLSEQLLQPVVAPSSGFTSLTVNAGKLHNTGTELAFTGIPVSSRSMTWTSRVTYQSNDVKVTNLDGVPTFAAAGSFGAQYGRNKIVQGLSTALIWGNVPLDAAGKILPKFSNVTNPTAVASTRDTIIGDANPQFQMAFTNTFRYKAATLSVLVDWRKGGDVANMTHISWDEGRQSRDYDDPSPVPGMTLGQFRYNGWKAGNDARVYVEDGGFVKVREIALGVDVPASLYKRMGSRVSSARIQLQARNAFMFTKYWGLDPEFNNFGNTNLNRFIDLSPMPNARAFSLSFDFGF